MASLFVRVLQAHQWIYVHSNGFAGHHLLFGNPTLLLRSTGRRSGQVRTSALTYARDDDSYLVTASNGGSPRNPAWVHNLDAKPECAFQVGRHKFGGTARVTLPDDPDYARRWELVNAANKDRYRGYQKMTKREIPIVVLTPSR